MEPDFKILSAFFSSFEILALKDFAENEIGAVLKHTVFLTAKFKHSDMIKIVGIDKALEDRLIRVLEFVYWLGF